MTACPGVPSRVQPGRSITLCAGGDTTPCRLYSFAADGTGPAKYEHGRWQCPKYIPIEITPRVKLITTENIDYGRMP